MFIKVRNLIHRYKIYSGKSEEETFKTALDDVSLQVEKGQFIGILGANGSGKSTLARHLAALLHPSDGIVIVGGYDASDPGQVLNIRKISGMVFQNPDNQMVGSLVEEDVAFGPENLGLPPEEIDARITEALETTGMSAYRFQSPHALSGGQKQKIAISGILAMEPECIILDEPTAMTDPQSRKELLEVMKSLNKDKGITIILVTHFTEEVRKADYLYLMNDGKIAARGTVDLLSDQARLVEQCGASLLPETSLIRRLRAAGYPVPEGLTTEEELIREFVRKGISPDKESSGAENNCLPKDREAAGRTGNAVIELDQVSYRYGNSAIEEGTLALNNVSLRVMPGEFVALIGPVGAGKSTLLQHLNGLLEPFAGTVRYGDENLWEDKKHQADLRKKVALCFQYPEDQLFEETLLKDIAFGPKNHGYRQKEAEDMARNAMRITGLSPELENVSPFTLSGGEKRRAALAGLLAMEPEVLVLDEPVAGLDGSGRQALFELLHRLNREKGLTVIFTSHSMDQVAEHADRVLVMKEGQIILDDRPEEVFRHRQLLRSSRLGLPWTVEFLEKLAGENGEDCEDSMIRYPVPVSVDKLAEVLIKWSRNDA